MGIIKRLNQVFYYNYSISKVLRMKKVFVSDIAESIYCEWRKVLERRHGKIKTQIMELGSKIHEDYFSYNIESFDEAEEKMEKGEVAFFSSKVSFIDHHRKIIVSGQVDSAAFDNNDIVKIIELKTREKLKIYDSDIIQIGTYALCLEKMLKRNLDDLQLQIVVSSRNSKQDYIDQNYRFGEIKVYVLETIEDILDFWSMRREPKISDSSSTCRVCHFFEVCDKRKL